MLNLYKLSATNFDYDIYTGAIVAAENEDAARLIHPSGDETSIGYPQKMYGFGIMVLGVVKTTRG